MSVVIKGVMMGKAIGEYIQELISLRSLNATQVAAAAGVSGQYVYKLRRGENKDPSMDKIKKLVKAVQGHWLHVGWLLGQRDPAKGKWLAQAHFNTEQGRPLSVEQRTVMTELLQDPEIAAAVVAAIGARQGTP